MIRSLAALSPDARGAAEAYLASVAPAIAPDDREAVLAGLREFLCDRLDAQATAADVTAVTDQIGPVAPDGAEPAPAERLRRLLGEGTRLLGEGTRLKGMDARIAGTWWNPSDPRLFLPRAVGLGWDLNFGALAVRLGLIEPDSEAVPFASTPDAAFRVAAGLPIALAGATVLHYLVRGRNLPARLPAHWDAAGAPDRWTTKRRAAVADLTVTVLPAAVAGWAAGSSRPGPSRAGAIAGSTALASVGAVVTVWRSLGEGRRPWMGAGMLGVLTGSVGAVLLGLARAGRTAEIRRDLERDRQSVRVPDPEAGRDLERDPEGGAR